jgi:hypothetical protein
MWVQIPIPVVLRWTLKKKMMLMILLLPQRSLGNDAICLLLTSGKYYQIPYNRNPVKRGIDGIGNTVTNDSTFENRSRVGPSPTSFQL